MLKSLLNKMVQLQQMKSKHNSNRSSKAEQKWSMLIKNPNLRTKLKSIPTDLGASIKVVDCRNNKISQLSGIQTYRLLQQAILTDNQIENVEQFKYLRCCPNLKQVKIDGNPICQKVHYKYRIMCVLNRTITINDMEVGETWDVIDGWQTQNGRKVAQFLLQSCLILNQISKQQGTINIEQAKQQLQYLKQQFTNLQHQQKTQAQTVSIVNNAIFNNLPLKTIQIFEYSQQQLAHINDYLIQKLIQAGTQLNSQFIFKLLEGVEVNDEEQVNIVKKPEIAELIIRQQIQRQYNYDSQLRSNMNKFSHHNNKQIEIKHLRSADTALDTLDTAKRQTNYFTHFSLDAHYLAILNQVIISQINRLLSVIDKSATQVTENTISGPTLKTKYLPNLIRSVDTFEETQLFDYQSKIYNNPNILTNIVQMLQNTIKRITIRKLKKLKSKQTKIETCQLLERSLQRVINKIFYQSLSKITQPYTKQIIVVSNLNHKKICRIFLAWKQIKLRKLKLFDKILNKKIKASTFMMAITMTKWKMNTRSQKLKRRASLALLGSLPKVCPSSKKGIELAYRRIANKKYKVH